LVFKPGMKTDLVASLRRCLWPAAVQHPAAAALVLVVHPAVSLKLLLVPAAVLHLKQLLLLGLGSSNALVAADGAAEGCCVECEGQLYV
jgi:hypothetical protein